MDYELLIVSISPSLSFLPDNQTWTASSVLNDKITPHAKGRNDSDDGDVLSTYGRYVLVLSKLIERISPNA